MVIHNGPPRSRIRLLPLRREHSRRHPESGRLRRRRTIISDDDRSHREDVWSSHNPGRQRRDEWKGQSGFGSRRRSPRRRMQGNWFCSKRILVSWERWRLWYEGQDGSSLHGHHEGHAAGQHCLLDTVRSCGSLSIRFVCMYVIYVCVYLGLYWFPVMLSWIIPIFNSYPSTRPLVSHNRQRINNVIKRIVVFFRSDNILVYAYVFL